jgi:uncharacterized membrane protein YphA (DoxX/SURF4 family)
MNIALWVVQGLLAVFFLYAGLSKIINTWQQQVEKLPQMKDISPVQQKLIGVAETLGAIGVIVPWLTGILPVLTPLAAVGLALVMLCAALYHIVGYKQYSTGAFTLTVMLLAVFVACGRFLTW